MQSKGVLSPLLNFQSSEKGYSDWALNIDNKQHLTVWMASHGLFTESARAPHSREDALPCEMTHKGAK